MSLAKMVALLFRGRWVKEHPAPPLAHQATKTKDVLIKEQ